MQLVTLFRFVEALIDAPGGATLTFSTDLPGNAMAARATAAIPATSGRHPYRLALPGATKGKLYGVKVVPVGAFSARIYAAKVYARVLGPAPSDWAWFDVPVLQTSIEWSAIQLPIPQTSPDWSAIKLPVPPTSDDWAAVQLPVKPTPVVPEWASVQVDA